MKGLGDEELERFRRAVAAAASRPQVRHAVKNVYAALEDAISLRRPICAASGRCCRFEEVGHRLYVTTMELAAFLHDVPEIRPAGDPGRCPYQLDRLCSVHEARPFGCRVFFCDATATMWQQEQYARYHAELKRLHDELEVPYFYVEWRQGLAMTAGLEIAPCRLST